MTSVFAADPDPSKTSTVGMTVNNPVTGTSTKVLSLIMDPAPIPPATTAAVAFVRTEDGYVFMVKAVGEIIYNDGIPPQASTIVSKNTTTHTVELRPVGADPAVVPTETLPYQTTYANLQSLMNPPDETVATPPTVGVFTADGVRSVLYGGNGSNGRDGAIFVPPNSGGNGGTGPTNNYTNTLNISTNGKIGIEVGSLGGNGGAGGDSYLSFWSGRDGGDGGAGGTVSVINNAGVQVITSGDNMHGIFAYSRGGQAGNGGGGFAAPGGGTGGHSSNGGNVSVTNNGLIRTSGVAAYGIYALSVSNNGGNGGSTWGIVGTAGSGGYGGSGGTINVTNSATGSISTTGDFGHGIFAQSIGGTGGSSGTSANLILSLPSGGDNGGNGSTVQVSNSGIISTTGDDARGIFAQSIGGGGGSGGTSAGLISLGGSGANGGSAGAVTVQNLAGGRITTTGLRSDGIFAQAVGGSSGNGANAGGLVSVGGNGAKGGNGGAVTVENYGTIFTTQDFARGIVAQSIGGGGGDGGSTGGIVAVGGSGSGGGIGALVTIKNGGVIKTTGTGALGVLAQSIGGGGGNGGSSGSVGIFAGVAVGGKGGEGGTGGDVNVTMQGQDASTTSLISTTGDRSTALFAQSVGGGGGNGGGAVQVSVGFGAAASFAIGGNAGKASNGGLVTLSKGTGKSIIETGGDDSTGVFLQSVGGGGGNGGYAVSVAVSAGPASGSLAVGIGGTGGAAGIGGDVTVGVFANNIMTASGFDGSILTTGNRSTGLLAQSVGGGGGNGGLAVAGSASASLTMSGSISVGLGGKGGSGGAGGTVQVGLDGNITTQGHNSAAMLVQSVGGGGGNGGGSIAAAFAAGAGGATVGISLGGDGGAGSNGGLVNVTTTAGNIKTSGSQSTGILIQSVGGGGGNGGYSVSAGLAAGALGAGAVNVGLGGAGGNGSTGGNVTADLQSNVETSSVKRALDPVTSEPIPEAYMTDSTGVLVQSVGGGGGNGGFSITAGVAGAGTGSGAVTVGLGGNGGAGGTGGIVNVKSTGSIQTKGDRSAGLVAQSIGGGGGNGGYNIAVAGAGAGVGSGAISVGLGGTGGSGNFAQAVTVNTSIGKISTEGADSIGILAQSIGGGGGNGGYNVTVAASAAGTGSGAISVGLGGNGGTGGYAGAVNLTVANAVTTAGKNSAAIVAQAIGGGGGSGGYNVSAGGSAAGTGSGAVSVGLGGSGAGGGNGGTVTALISGNVETLLENSAGILAQSIGGGGGNGGYNVSVSGSGAGTGSGVIGVGLGGSGAGGGNGLKVDVTSQGTLITKGANSTALIAQSIGGGGGNGGFNVTVALSGAGTGSGALSVGLGGSGAGGGDGGIVVLSTSGNISTSGDKSGGILAQSVGGGGGNGGFDVSVAGSGAGTGSGAVSVGIGGSGAGGGNADTVDVTVANSVTTTGKNATGIIAQSIGGGGGNGGFTVTAPISGAGTGSGAVGVGIGGSAGTGGFAKAVTSHVTGNVLTSNTGSGGILAQSLGGGGGNGGMAITGALSFAGTGSGAVSIGLGGSGGGGGYAGKVTSTLIGNVYTTAADSFGVMAQSLGGGGGNGGMSISGAIGMAKTGAGALAIGLGGAGGTGGDAGEVVSTITGYVQTQGNNSGAILAQSLGGGGGNGGINISGTITAAQTGSGGVAFGIGGFGGSGGHGTTVTNTVTGGAVTTGNFSDAIVAQSLGGGGGNGALSVSGAVNITKENGGSLGIGIGGFGGNGGNAGDVTSTIKTTTAYTQIGTTGDNSSAVVAQSLGGGGGNGGMNVTGVVNLTSKNGAAVGVGVGGFGGGAGTAGIVKVDVDGQIVTQGNQSHGILAQSIGGGGGNGGTNVTGTLAITTASGGNATTVAASLGVGGFGGGGGKSGAVDVKYNGTLSARPSINHAATTDPLTGVVTPAWVELVDGEGANGIAAQSIGGGGGNGALNVSAGISYAKGTGDGYGIMIGVGGFGGLGGNADKVDVLVTGAGNITGYGAGHSAILAQSIGGGGGNGATNVSGGITSESALIVGVGGFGGNAGTAGKVTAVVTANVFASALNSKDFSSAGIMAQSLGGGGGNGGLNVSGGIALAKEDSVPSVTFGIGGFGGAGAISDDVTVTQVGNAVTSGNWIHGVMAQSIAGGGGNGGMNVSGQINFADSDASGGKKDLTIVAGIGGNGGKGADAGDATITQNGIVSTKGDYARGVVSQSIGGGGGTGGMNVTGVFAKNSSPISIGVGGSGTGGGHAGAATVNRGLSTAFTGQVTTDGKGAHAIEASSIGGGGGDAGMNFNAGVSLVGKGDTAPGFAANFAIGGAGGEAGNGGIATVNNYSAILTKGDNSHGIMAQSIGGGGGNGNFNVSVLWADSKNSNQEKKNLGFSLAVGGQPGDGGYGERVDVVQVGNIETLGKQSYGILAQSIGGGGGNTGLDLAMAIASGGNGSMTIGRVGGIGGHGSDVTLNYSGTLITRGEGSFGMLAQSVGNGGGNSSSSSVSITGSDTKDNPADSVYMAIGLEGGQGGYAGNVTLDAAGFVDTYGKGAHAIFAQSVGGGGGNGGSANTFGLTTNTVAVTIGGTGGTGGYGGIVDVNNLAQLRTFGESSIGILAQSVGGGGGNGGMSRSGGVESKVDGISIGIGGSGGTGMAGGNVIVGNAGIIITDGLGSHGVLAQSLGGGGGNAGMTINATWKNSDENPSNNAAISIGGTGGGGAISGNVTVTNTGGIGTSKASSVGIFAQAIGGGGGNANTVSTNAVEGKGGGNNLVMGIGGSGGTGAAAGKVTVSNLIITGDANSGKIITVGNFSHGILAMSVGGGGGTGSTVITTLKKAGSPVTDTTTNAFIFSLGGHGGDGGTGGIVEVENEGSITTYGYKAHGILAQSIGGGGGNGGMSITGDLTLGKKTSDGSSGSIASMALGGFGGTGNTAGAVTVTNSGVIDVSGKGAYGIYAQSVGGGGGDGGFAATISRNLLANPKTDLKKSLMNIGMGGNGGDGANGGNVTVNHSGTITARGDNSYGIFAQSVGGGGGNAAHAITGPAWMAADLAFETILGGRGGSNGSAGIVKINTTGTITMLGKNSVAQLAQSINGGGGNVELFLDVSQHAIAIGDDGIELPNNGGDVDKVFAFIDSVIKMGAEGAQGLAASAIDATHVGDLYTSAVKSIGSLLQSIGGGGGNGDQEVVVDSNAQVNLLLALGGKDSANNNGGDVVSNRDGKVVTLGDGSAGVSTQSIGGGGGNLSVTVRTVPAASSLAAFSLLAAPPPPPPTLASLGADGGLTSDGGNLNITSSGDVGTVGTRSPAMAHQTIGGGGGKLSLFGLTGLNLTVGGINNASGNGGNITFSNLGRILTEGVLSHGLILQTIGGGGGIALTDLDASNIAITASTANAGSGGNIDATQNGDVSTTGARSIAVILQSLGGGGGLVDDFYADSAGGVGNSGSITLRMNGNVIATGAGGVGILAQSKATGTQGNIVIDLAATKNLFFGAGGTGVKFSGGANNLFTNNGTVAGIDNLTGWGARGEAGNETFQNNGTFVGQVDLGAGTNQFNNANAALLVLGPQFFLGAASNQLINDGTMRPGDTGLAQHTDMTGSFTQTTAGKTLAELDFGTQVVDNVSMTGAASMAGSIEVALLSPQLVPVGSFQKILFHADGGVTDNGMDLVTAPSVVINYALNYLPSGDDLALDYSVNFNPPGSEMSRNLVEVGAHINSIQNAGSSPSLAAVIIRLLYEPTLDGYRLLLSQMGPDFYGEQQAEMLRGTQRFGETVLSGGNTQFASKGRRIWFDVLGSNTFHGRFDDYKTVQQQTTGFAIGFESIIARRWSAGLAVALEDNTATGYEGRWSAQGTSQRVGGVLRFRTGSTEFAGLLSYGWNNMDSSRVGQVTTPFDTNVSRDLQTATAMLRASHQFGDDSFAVIPRLDLGVTHLSAKQATESGADAISLYLHDQQETHAWVRPAITIRKAIPVFREAKLRIHAEFGYQYYLTGNDTYVRGGFTGAPGGVDPMNVPIDLGSMATLSVGAQLLLANDLSIGLYYTKALSEKYKLDLWNFRVNKDF